MLKWCSDWDNLESEQMAFYKYKSVDRRGKYMKGSLEAVDEASALYLVKQKGLTPLEISIDKDISRLLKKANYNRVPIKVIAMLTRQFATILAAGVTVISAMDMLKKQASNKFMRKALETAYEDLQKGRSLAQSLRNREGENVFPQLLVNMIEAGEISGTLEETMLRMAEHYEKENRINQKIKAAMTYPAILLCISALMVVFMVYFILPSFMTLIDTNSVEIPALTKAVINMTEFIRIKWYIIIAALVTAAAFFKYLTGRGRVRIMYHRLLLKLPVLGKVIRRITASRFARTLGMLQKSGIPLISSLASVKNVVGNGVAEEAIERAITAVKNGQGLAAPLEASGAFEVVLVKMVQVGEETGSLDEMLMKTADYFDVEVETGLNQLMLFIEPAMLIIMGAVVGTIVIAMLLPMYGMLNNLGI